MEVCTFKLQCLCLEYMAELMLDCCRINHDVTFLLTATIQAASKLLGFTDSVSDALSK
jgi:hypothetical protein